MHVILGTFVDRILSMIRDYRRFSIVPAFSITYFVGEYTILSLNNSLLFLESKFVRFDTKVIEDFGCSNPIRYVIMLCRRTVCIVICMKMCEFSQSTTNYRIVTQVV